MSKTNAGLTGQADAHIFFDENLEKATDVSKCPACGANLTFDPESQSLSCAFCGNEEAIMNKARSEEQQFEKLLHQKSAWNEETHIFKCNNCGAKEVLSKDDMAKHCPFCGTTNIIRTDELSGLKPNAVVPFRLTKQSACERVIKWAKSKLFAPRAFKKSVTPEEIAGTYNPAFTFDADTFTNYHGRLAIRKTRTKTVNGKTVTESYEVYFNINGSYSHYFDDILVQASSHIKQNTLNKLGGFDTNASNVYSSEFLHGYTALQYSKDGIQCWEEAKRSIHRNIERAILAKYTYSRVVYFRADTAFQKITYKYILLPVYVGHCNWKTKLYNFFVNGFNGKVTGKTPVSPLRVSIAVGIGLLVAGGIVLALHLAGVFT